VSSEKLKYQLNSIKTEEVKIFLLVVLGIIDLICLAIFIYLWQSSKYPGAEIGNMDWGLAKFFGIAFVIISLVIGAIIFFKK